MDIKLLSLELQNFKGVKEFTFTPDGTDADIYGDNETGKTTLVDAFLWLLFGKDSRGRSDFEIKTLDGDNNPVHNLDHSVAGLFSVDGKHISLQKTFREKWTKKRGATQAEFTGHETKYHINGVPAKAKEFQARVDEIVSEDLFRLLTDPRYFNSLHWEKRREIVFSVIGNVPDEEVINSDSALAGLNEILDGHSIDDKRKVIAERRKKINEELKEIPARIDELRNSIPEAADLGQLKHDLANAQQQKIFFDQERQNLLSGDGRAEIESRIADAKARKQTALTNHNTKKQERIADLRAELSKKQTILHDTKRLKGESEQAAHDADIKAQAAEKKKEALREAWHQINNKKYDGGSTCPTCGQEMPAEMLMEAKKKFNQQKADKLAENNAAGKAAAAEAEQERKKKQEAEEKIADAAAIVSEVILEIDGLEKKIKEAGSEGVDVSNFDKEIEELQAKLDAEEKPDTSELDGQIQEWNEKITALQNEIAEQKQREKSEARVKELTDKDSALAAEFERLESELFVIEKFTATKARMLEDKINSRFEITRFKLFEEQINGGIAETCVSLYNGVPYGSMNNAARVNVGLDIINVLSDHYGATAPIWIDNAEAVTDYLDTSAQVIRLNVSPDYPELTIK
jgi:DNA repair exonuclease SbcCD ATPase subunit